ncbi:MAG: hypothetical protein EBT71_05890 [Alphaproteobacteria bacterium]|nr:hypothetical protein [Alphaproteobacteria bacterium]
MAEKLILSIDQGTTSSRALAIDESGHVQGVAQQEFRQIFPEDGWVEHDANEIWDTTLAVCKRVLQDCGADNFAGIAITNQRETVVLWERATGKPLHHAIVWQDRRTAQSCEALRAAGHEATITAKTGLLLDPYFSASKIGWLLDHVPDTRARAEAGELACGTIDSWLVWQLTKGASHATDATNAARTSLYNIHDNKWDGELLSLFNVPEMGTGKLNPRWVETLMGLPVGWTMPSCASPATIAPMNCGSSAMELYPQPLQSPSQP